VAVAALNAAWAAGAAFGAVAASSVAEHTGFIVPFGLLGGLCLVSAAILFGRSRSDSARRVASEQAS
jgi:hypothetical protein